MKELIKGKATYAMIEPSSEGESGAKKDIFPTVQASTRMTEFKMIANISAGFGMDRYAQDRSRTDKTVNEQ